MMPCSRGLVGTLLLEYLLPQFWIRSVCVWEGGGGVALCGRTRGSLWCDRCSEGRGDPVLRLTAVDGL